MKQFVKAAALAATVVAVSAIPTHATVVELTLTADTSTNSFSVFEQNANPSDTVGLDGLGFDVTGSGGIAVTSVLNGMLRGTDNELGTTGFTEFRTNGTISAGSAHDISGFQNAGTYSVNSLGDVKTVYTGIGDMAESINTGYTGGDGVTDAAPAMPTFKNASLPYLLATGHYTGTSGTLTVASDVGRVALLPDPTSFPTAGPGQTSASYQTHSPDAVMGQTVSIPEPSILWLMVALPGALRRRRRTA